MLWRRYTDEKAFIFSETNGVPHNTITPIARKRGDLFELDLVLRNNITTEEFPLGVYHPHPEYHHIKKENIGLIEVMGLAVLPARLQMEMAELERRILQNEDLRESDLTKTHADSCNRAKGNRICVCKSAGMRRCLQKNTGRTRCLQKIFGVHIKKGPFHICEVVCFFSIQFSQIVLLARLCMIYMFKVFFIES